MKALVTTADRRQFLVSHSHFTELDEMGKETKRQCSLSIAPILKPGMPLVYATEGEVRTEEIITGVLWR